MRLLGVAVPLILIITFLAIFALAILDKNLSAAAAAGAIAVGAALVLRMTVAR